MEHFLVPILPPDLRGSPRPGRRIRWPGEDREWVWDGEAWVTVSRQFDGGDVWRDEDDLEQAA